ncbi:hypothetical protein ACFL3E_02415 [Patescibacteria group bacterium]
MPGDFKLEDEWKPPVVSKPIPKAVKFLNRITGGAIKTEKQASIVLLISTIVLIAASIYFFNHSKDVNLENYLPEYMGYYE